MQLEIKSNQSVSVDSNNKIVNSKMSVRDNRTEPRLVINKDNDPMPGKAVKALPRIPLKTSSKHPDSYRKSLKSSRSSKSTNSDGSSSKGSSTSSLDSPSKSKSDKNNDSSKSRSPTKSPSKHKKKDVSSSSSRNDKKSDKTSKSSKSENRLSSKSDSLSSTSFKELKGSAKNRNYIRRNRDVSASPEPTFDVDLRLASSLEKDSRLQGDAAEDTCKDI